MHYWGTSNVRVPTIFLWRNKTSSNKIPLLFGATPEDVPVGCASTLWWMCGYNKLVGGDLHFSPIPVSHGHGLNIFLPSTRPLPIMNTEVDSLSIACVHVAELLVT